MADLFLGGSINPATHERTTTDRIGQRGIVPTDSLTTHGVIVGMTGSGKTGLGVILIEEALRAGLPVLAIDPKGDLTNLCLTFPDLSPADFRPWIDEAQAKNAGESPDDFATSQAATLDQRPRPDGALPAPTSAPSERRPTSRSTRPARRPACRSTSSDRCRCPPTCPTPRWSPTRSRATSPASSGLVGIAADPLASREHILLSNLIQHSWSEGRPLDLMTLVGMIPVAARSASSACSTSTSSSPPPTAWRWR
jgi:hypothetical protein